MRPTPTATWRHDNKTAVPSRCPYRNLSLAAVHSRHFFLLLACFGCGQRAQNSRNGRAGTVACHRQTQSRPASCTSAGHTRCRAGQCTGCSPHTWEGCWKSPPWTVGLGGTSDDCGRGAMGWTLPVATQSARLPHMGHLTAPRPLPSSEFRLSVHYCRYCTWQSVSGMSRPSVQASQDGRHGSLLGSLAAAARRS